MMMSCRNALMISVQSSHESVLPLWEDPKCKLFRILLWQGNMTSGASRSPSIKARRILRYLVSILVKFQVPWQFFIDDWHRHVRMWESKTNLWYLYCIYICRQKSMILSLFALSLGIHLFSSISGHFLTRIDHISIPNLLSFLKRSNFITLNITCYAMDCLILYLNVVLKSRLWILDSHRHLFSLIISPFSLPAQWFN